jgi:hypothetical protein
LLLLLNRQGEVGGRKKSFSSSAIVIVVGVDVDVQQLEDAACET